MLNRHPVAHFFTAMYKHFLLSLLVVAFGMSAAFAQKKNGATTSGSGTTTTPSTTTTPGVPSSADMSAGLKEALKQGVATAVGNLGKTGGFANDAKVRIPFPKDALFVADALRKAGLGSMVDNFETRLNAAGEDAVKTALPIFTNALTQMSISDASSILLSGNQRAATEFFERTTRQQLYNLFAPKVKASLDKVNATKLWKEITTKYNAIPFVTKKVQTDLVKYVTDKTLDGLFVKVADEEAKIRANPLQSASTLIQNVFNFALGKK